MCEWGGGVVLTNRPTMAPPQPVHTHRHDVTSRGRRRRAERPKPEVQDLSYRDGPRGIPASAAAGAVPLWAPVLTWDEKLLRSPRKQTPQAVPAAVSGPLWAHCDQLMVRRPAGQRTGPAAHGLRTRTAPAWWRLILASG